MQPSIRQFALAFALLGAVTAVGAQTVPIVGLVEQSGGGATVGTNFNNGVLFDVRYDNKGDLDRESFFVKVDKGRAQVIQTFKPVIAAR